MRPMTDERLAEIRRAFGGACAPPAQDAWKMGLELLAELGVRAAEVRAADLVISELDASMCDLHDTHDRIELLGTKHTDSDDGLACDDCAKLHGFTEDVPSADVFRVWNECQKARWGGR